MAISTFMGLETTLRGLIAHQRALDVTGHNIANANTVGYTRQEAVLATTTPLREYGVGLLGTGVEVTEYTRKRDAFIDIQLRAQTMKRGYSDARQDGLQQVELGLAEPGDNGLSSLFQRFWSSWQDVANTPESLATRQSLIQNAGIVANGLRDLSDHMATIQTQTGQNVTVTIDEINSVGSRIAALNGSIVAAKQAGNTPNDLLDERDVLLDRLAELGNVSWTNQADGSIDVVMGGGALVTGQVSATLAEAGFTSLTSGKLKALIELRDTTIPGYKTQLNSIAKALADKVNAQHALGFDLATGAAGGAFFTYTAGSEASTLAVSAAIAANPNLVAASSTAPLAAGAQAGNGGNAIAISQLANDPLIDAAYKKLVTTIGTDTQEALRSSDSARILSDSLANRRASLSGVSLDEEMTNMIKYQRGYQAAARALNAMDDMVELLITRTGRVGV